MKRCFLVILLVISWSASVAWAKDEQSLTAEVLSLLEEYSDRENVQCEKAKGLMLSMFKTMFKASAGNSKEAKEAIRNMKDIIYFFYDKASPELKSEFEARLEPVLEKAPYKEDMKNKEGSFSCYGLSHSNNEVVQNIVVKCSKPCILICFVFD